MGSGVRSTSSIQNSSGGMKALLEAELVELAELVDPPVAPVPPLVKVRWGVLHAATVPKKPTAPNMRARESMRRAYGTAPRASSAAASEPVPAMVA